MQAKTLENPPTTQSVTTTDKFARALGIGITLAVSLGIYLGYHFGHGNSLRYWSILVGTGVLSFASSFLILHLSSKNTKFF